MGTRPVSYTYSPKFIPFQLRQPDGPAWLILLSPNVEAARRGPAVPGPPRTIRQAVYEFFEHTADLGLRVRAADLEGLFTEAARGLFSMIVENLDEVAATRSVRFFIEGDDPALLLLDWLNELLATFDTRHLLLSEFEVRLSGQGVEATARGEPLDEGRHRLDHEVKAITYHGLEVRRIDGGWEAEVIVDI